jgi:hypothetical protein
MSSLRPKFQNIKARRWYDLRDAWLENVPPFLDPGAKPDPGVERLAPLQELSLPDNIDRLPDVPGLRTNLLWEAVFLFHKCAHSHLAAQRLGHIGMHSWSMFNAYHAAYIGARGVMALLGIGLPFLPNGGQLLIDVFPQPESKKDIQRLKLKQWRFQEILIVRLYQQLDQRGLWEGFQRVLNISDVPCWDDKICQELLDVNCASITRPRNAFLYRAAFWPGKDLLVDGSDDDFTRFVGTGLNEEDEGFLLRLSFDVYRLFEQLIANLADEAGPIRVQLNESRIISDPSVSDLISYNAFLSQFDKSRSAQ